MPPIQRIARRDKRIVVAVIFLALSGNSA